MDFLEDLELYQNAMYNAYDFITGKKDIDTLIMKLDVDEIYQYPLPFDPLIEDGRNPAVIDMLIEYFTNIEEYEMCAELVKIKKECLKTLTE